MESKVTVECCNIIQRLHNQVMCSATRFVIFTSNFALSLCLFLWGLGGEMRIICAPSQSGLGIKYSLNMTSLAYSMLTLQKLNFSEFR